MSSRLSPSWGHDTTALPPVRSPAAVLLSFAVCSLTVAAVAPPGNDLRLSYFSAVDQTDQPYRIYVPSSYRPDRPMPLVIALHGTGGNESSLFEDKRLPPHAFTQAAEKHGVLMACPLGRGTTEFRGLGENDVFCVLADVRNRYRVDPDRVYLTGHSMGGTGTAYIALHHPDQFAAVAPLAAPYSFPWLAANLQHVPSWWILGDADLPYYLTGVAVGIERMRRLGVPVRHDLIPGEGHDAGIKRIDEVVGWLVQHKRNRHPTEYVFEVDTPLHGRAYWTSVTAIAAPGKMATVRARADGPQRVRLDLENVASLALFPDPEIFDRTKPLAVVVNGATVYSGVLPAGKQLRLDAAGPAWGVAVDPRREPDLTAYRIHPVAVAAERITNVGTESLLANWITNAMRDATGADIALYNRWHDRGLGIPQGTVDIVDLIECSRPYDQLLVTVEMAGRDLIELLDTNCVPEAKPSWRPSLITPEQQQWYDSRLLQISGAYYRFDPSRPAGQRIVATNLEPGRRYTVAMEGQLVERVQVLPAGRFRNAEIKTTATSFSIALYGHAARQKRIEAREEGRVRQVGP